MDSPSAPNSRVERIAVVGLGNVGRLIADMLVERGFEVWEADVDASRVAGERASVMDVSDPAALGGLFAGVDAVVSCLPYYLNAVIATAAHSAGVHYLDLTEDVATSRTVKELARSSKAILMPGCGLAPGFICVVGGSLVASLETVNRIELRVGALPRSPNNAFSSISSLRSRSTSYRKSRKNQPNFHSALGVQYNRPEMVRPTSSRGSRMKSRRM